MSAILKSAILDSAILNKKKFTHSFWLKFMMAAILNSTILDSAILHKNTSLIHSDSSWWWQPSWILPSWIQPLSSWIQTPCYLLSDSLKNTLTPICLWLKLIQSDSNSFILTQLDDVSHLEFCHLGFNHFEQKKTSLIHSHSTLWWQPSWILPSWIQLFCTKTLHLYILTQLDDCSHLESNMAEFKMLPSSSWVRMKQKHFTHSFWLILMMAAILNSAMLYSNTAILDSDTLLSSLRFTQKHSHSTLTLTQINSIWLKLIYSHLTWWWQPSWILPSWIWLFWIQPS